MTIKPFLTSTQISDRVIELAKEIEEYYKDRELTVIVVYNGAMFFAADLLRGIKANCEIVGMLASSYQGNTVSCGRVDFINNLDVDNKHVLIVDDIYDTGHTLHALSNDLRERGALTVEMCVLLNKEIEKKFNLDVLFIGFNIPDKFVYGYGLDIKNKFRNLTFIATNES